MLGRMSTMSAGRRAALILAVLVVAVLAVLAALAAVPVVIAVACVLLALVVGVRPHVRRWGRRSGRAAATPPAHPDRGARPGRADLDDELAHHAPLDELPAMRERVSTVLTEWNIGDEAVQPTLLVLTELLTNAIEHAAAPIRVTLEITSAVVRVQVHDATPELAQGDLADPARARGHGLELVAALAVRQGWTLEPDGKTVWADVPTGWPEPPSSGEVARPVATP